VLGSGKILSLDELESRIRQNSDHSANSQPKAVPQKPDEEMTAAFKRLVSTILLNSPTTLNYFQASAGRWSFYASERSYEQTPGDEPS